MEKDLVSVIVPVYNVEKYLRQCIDSIINQTYKNLEIILVDDGSPDNCPKICDEYAKKDERIIVIHKENGGLSSARNAGLDICTGDYISFIDSDDFVSPVFIEMLYTKLVKANADICQCDFVEYQENQNCVFDSTCNEVKKHNGVDMQLKMYEIDGYKNVVVWNKIYKRYLYEKMRFPESKINEDECTTYIVFDNSMCIITIDAKLYSYRINDNGIMRKKFNVKRLDIIEAYLQRLYYYNSKVNNNDCYNKLFIATVFAFNLTLKKLFFCAKDVKLEKKYLTFIKNEIQKNYLTYRKYEKNQLKKMKSCVFSFFPDMYYFLARIKDLY